MPLHSITDCIALLTKRCRRNLIFYSSINNIMACGCNYTSFHWVKVVDPRLNGDVLDKAIVAGYDGDDKIYVARGEYNYDVIPGKFVHSHRDCYVSYGGNEEPLHEFEVLCNPHECQLEWIRTTEDNIPTGAIQGGVKDSDQPLYIGRTKYEDSTVVGKVDPNHGCFYFPYGGKEHSSKEYEILVCTRLVLEKTD